MDYNIKHMRINNLISKLNKITSGFTIVELMIVIVMMTVLAAITYVTYDNWERNAITTQIKSDLNNTAIAMENARTFSNVYPTVIPSSISASDGVVLTGGGFASGKKFCVNAISSKDPAIGYYSISSIGDGQVVQSGKCNAWLQVAAGNDHTCGLYFDNTVYCWGDNTYAQLGIGEPVNNPFKTKPNPVDTTSGTSSLYGKTVTYIDVGDHHACAIDSTGGLHCWGNDVFGQLGDATHGSKRYPVIINGGSLAGKTVVAVSGGYHNTCAIDSTGSLSCWGQNVEGQMGKGTTDGAGVYYEEPQLVNGGSLAGKTVTKVAVGDGYVCAIDSTGGLHCWGYNGNGQVGINNTTTPQPTPLLINGGTLAGKTVIAVETSDYDTCALDSTAVLHCWGLDSAGAVGDNPTLSSKYAPVLVDTTVTNGSSLNGKTVTAFDLGGSHVCAIDSLNATHCWGKNTKGNLGIGSLTPDRSGIPVIVNTASGTSSLYDKKAAVISVGDNHACVIDFDSAIHCWGENVSGEIGNGTGDGSTSTIISAPTAVLSPY